MNIVIIADSIDTQHAGIHVYTRNMIEALQNQPGFHVVTIRQGKRKDITFRNDVLVKPLLPFLLKDPFRVFWRIPRTIARLNPDLVIEPAHFGPFNLPNHIKRVTVIHDLTPILFPSWHPILSRTLQSLFLKGILRRAAMVVVNSNNTANDVIKYFPEAKAKTKSIHPGIDPFFSPAENGETAPREPFFLFTGTIEPRKNLLLLLKAFQQFKETSNSPFKLVIVGGKGWKDRSFYGALAMHPYRNDIEVKGFVDIIKLRDLYRTASAFVYPSWYEGFGLPVAEAMACGAPCLVSDRSSLPEVGGTAALYFDPENAAALAQLMQQISSSETLVKSLAQKGIEQAARFSIENFAKGLKSAFENH